MIARTIAQAGVTLSVRDMSLNVNCARCSGTVPTGVITASRVTVMSPIVTSGGAGVDGSAGAGTIGLIGAGPLFGRGSIVDRFTGG
ncbi:hypothetical protein GCM10027344_31110 [Spelaeicoccus albus]